MALVVVSVWVRRRSWVGWTRLLLWAAALISTLPYARTIAIGAILLAPLFAEALQSLLPERVVPRRWEVRTLGLAALTSLLLATFLVPVTAKSPRGVPLQFDQTLAAMPAGTVVWNVDALGGWLLYSHPNVRPTIDTRAEVYGPDYVGNYVRALNGYPGWEQTVAATGASYAIIASDSPLASDLQREARWSAISVDPPYVLLKAPR